MMICAQRNTSVANQLLENCYIRNNNLS